jgi:hypothetical protein
VKALFIVGLVGVLAAGCDDKKSEAPAAPPASSAAQKTAEAAPTAAAPATAAAAPGAAAPAATAAAGEVPAEEDFEERANATVTPANADQELAKLEKEIGQ